jgi:hypothetical protein
MRINRKNPHRLLELYQEAFYAKEGIENSPLFYQAEELRRSLGLAPPSILFEDWELRYDPGSFAVVTDLGTGEEEGWSVPYHNAGRSFGREIDLSRQLGIRFLVPGWRPCQLEKILGVSTAQDLVEKVIRFAYREGPEPPAEGWPPTSLLIWAGIQLPVGSLRDHRGFEQVREFVDFYQEQLLLAWPP